MVITKQILDELTRRAQNTAMIIIKVEINNINNINLTAIPHVTNKKR